MWRKKTNLKVNQSLNRKMRVQMKMMNMMTRRKKKKAKAILLINLTCLINCRELTKIVMKKAKES